MRAESRAPVRVEASATWSASATYPLLVAERYPWDWVWIASRDPPTSTSVIVAAMPTNADWPSPRPGARRRLRLALGIQWTIAPAPGQVPVDATRTDRD